MCRLFLLKILQICPGAYQSGRGGISEHVMNISERLAKRHDVTVYATNPNGCLPWFEKIKDVKVQRFRRLAPNSAYYFSPHMATNLIKSKFDLVHGHGYQAFPMHFAYLADCKKFVVTPHFHGSGHSVLRNCLFRLFKPIGKITLEKANKIIAVSEFEQDLLGHYFNLNLNKVVVIPNGVATSEFEGLRRDNLDFRSILYVGRLEKYKGVQYIVEVLPLLPKDIILEVVGRGPFKSFLEKRANELGVKKRVVFFQDLSRHELLQKYVNSTLFILLSSRESYSLVIAEALTAGVTCIVADTSALSEWIDNSTCFGLKEPININTLFNIITKIINNAPKNCLHYQKEILDWDNVVKRLESLYESI